MTDALMNIVALSRSLGDLSGKTPFCFPVTDVPGVVLGLAKLINEENGDERLDAVAVAQSMMTVKGGLMSLPMTNLVWWHYQSLEDPSEKKLMAVFLEKGG